MAQGGCPSRAPTDPSVRVDPSGSSVAPDGGLVTLRKLPLVESKEELGPPGDRR